MKNVIIVCGILASIGTLQLYSQVSLNNTPKDKHALVKSNFLSRIVLLGDETHVSSLRASPEKYMGRQVTVVGCVRVNNYYNYGFQNASSSHFSLSFDELSPDMKSIGSLDLYASRRFAQPLVDSILVNEATGHGKAVRLKISITDRSFDNRNFHECAELVDWQFVNESRNGWTPWAMELTAAENAKRDARQRQLAEDQRQAAKTLQEQKAQATKEKVLKSNQESAARGESYGLMRMGERYRDGDGVGKDLTKAKEYLQKAADAGSPTAVDALKAINR